MNANAHEVIGHDPFLSWGPVVPCVLRSHAFRIDDYALEKPEAANKDQAVAEPAADNKHSTLPALGKVMCISARGVLDEAAAHLLSQLLAKERIESVILDRAATARLNRGVPFRGTRFGVRANPDQPL